MLIVVETKKRLLDSNHFEAKEIFRCGLNPVRKMFIHFNLQISADGNVICLQ